MSHCTCGCGHGITVSTMTPPLTADTTVDEAKRRPGALDVLERFGINHCCGAPLALREAAAAAGASLDEVLSALAMTEARP